jgi:hypothetical protein
MWYITNYGNINSVKTNDMIYSIHIMATSVETSVVARVAVSV